jgi:hypothetical protein
VRTGKAAFAAFLSILLLAPAASAAVTISFVRYDSPNDHLGHLYQDSDNYVWDNGGDTADPPTSRRVASPPVLVAGRRRNHHLLRCKRERPRVSAGGLVAEG